MDEPNTTNEHTVLRDLASLIGAPLTEGNSLEQLINGDRIFPPMLEAIVEAEDTIDFLSYVYWQGPVARDFARELADAARRGVEVRVLLDALGALAMDDKLVELMRSGGCQVEFFHPLSRFSLKKTNERTHRKILVVDGRIGFTGGVGIAKEWSGDARNADEWRDDHYRIRGPVVSWLQGAFAANWLEVCGEALSSDRFFGRAQREGKITIVPIFGIPGVQYSAIALSYAHLIRAARERIDLTTPYFVPREEVLRELTAALERGVQVRLLCPGRHNDSKLAQWASKDLQTRLVEAGGELYCYRDTMIHCKTLLVDDRWAILGSANFDARSFEINHELNLAVTGEGVVRRLREVTDADIQRSQRVTAEELRGRSLWRHARTHMALWLREQL